MAVGALGLEYRAAAGGSSARQVAQRDAVGAFGVPHAGGERESYCRGVGALPKDCEGLRGTPVIASQRVARMRARWQAPRSNPYRGKLESWIASSRSLSSGRPKAGPVGSPQ